MDFHNNNLNGSSNFISVPRLMSFMLDNVELVRFFLQLPSECYTLLSPPRGAPIADCKAIERDGGRERNMNNEKFCRAGKACSISLVKIILDHCIVRAILQKSIT